MTHRWRFRKFPVEDWDQGQAAGLRHGQRCRVLARGNGRGGTVFHQQGRLKEFVFPPHNLLVEFEDGTMMVGQRGSAEPIDQRQMELF